MKLTTACWSYPALTLPEVAGLARVLGLDAIDVGVDGRSALDRGRLLSDPEGLATEVASTGMPVACCYYRFGEGLVERNLADPVYRPANLRDFGQVLRFCRAARVPTIFLLPGIVNPGQTGATALAESAASLRPLLEAAAAAGVTLTIEAHVQSLVESPRLTLDLLREVPGLRLALDYSHFICLGFRQEEIDVLLPHAGHVHLRQARPGLLQTKFDQGTINFPVLLGELRASGYRGYLCLENSHQAYMDTWYDDVLTETVRMRDLVRAYL